MVTGGHGDIGDIVMLGDMVVTAGDTVTFLPLSVPQLGPRRMPMVKRETANQVGRKGALGKARRRKRAQLRGCAPRKCAQLRGCAPEEACAAAGMCTGAGPALEGLAGRQEAEEANYKVCAEMREDYKPSCAPRF